MMPMHGALSRLFLAELPVPDRADARIGRAPYRGRSRLVVDQTNRSDCPYMFPYLEWEHDLGWLNIKRSDARTWACACFGLGVCHAV